MVCPGNHELEGGALFTAYDHRFAGMPAAAGSKGSPQWFSWESGPVHMIQLK